MWGAFIAAIKPIIIAAAVQIIAVVVDLLFNNGANSNREYRSATSSSDGEEPG